MDQIDQEKDFISYSHRNSISPKELIEDYLEPSLKDNNQKRFLTYEEDG